jgi:hypothetical protein
MTAHHIDGHLARMNNVATGRTRRIPEPEWYEIRVSGRLADRWAAVLDGMTLVPQDDGTTVIHGLVADQSALHGLLRQLSDLGLPLVSVHQTDPPTQAPTQIRSTT